MKPCLKVYAQDVQPQTTTQLKSYWVQACSGMALHRCVFQDFYWETHLLWTVFVSLVVYSIFKLLTLWSDPLNFKNVIKKNSWSGLNCHWTLYTTWWYANNIWSGCHSVTIYFILSSLGNVCHVVITRKYSHHLLLSLVFCCLNFGPELFSLCCILLCYVIRLCCVVALAIHRFDSIHHVLWLVDFTLYSIIIWSCQICMAHNVRDHWFCLGQF